MNGNRSTSGCLDQPDPDAIKMFVGQIPRSMDENDLRKMFEQYGQVYQINVLRDKVTGQSKGISTCSFCFSLEVQIISRLVVALHLLKWPLYDWHECLV